MGNKKNSKVEDVVENETPEVPEVEPTNEVENEEDKHSGAIAKAVVVGCTKLNVRENADKNSKVICVIEKGKELTVDLDAHTTEDFYKVCFDKDEVLYAGYCVKDFISII